MVYRGATIVLDGTLASVRFGYLGPWEIKDMLTIHKKLVVDEHGTPHEVILPWEEYRQIEQLLGFDLTPDAVADLEQAAKDRQSGTPGAYEDLDSI